jgi:hypothetical protein
MRQTLIQSGLYPTFFQLPLLPTGLMGSWSTSTWQAASRSAQTSEVCTECMNAEVHCSAQEGAWNWQLSSLPVLADYPPRDLHLCSSLTDPIPAQTHGSALSGWMSQGTQRQVSNCTCST